MTRRYVTSKNVVNSELHPAFIDDIVELERKGALVQVRRSAYGDNICITPDTPHYNYFKNGSQEWKHDNDRWPILVDKPVVRVQLPEDLFEL